MRRALAGAMIATFVMTLTFGLIVGHQQRDLHSLRAEIAAQGVRLAAASATPPTPDPLTADVARLHEALAAQTLEDARTEGRLLALENAARSQPNGSNPAIYAAVASLRSELATQKRSIDDVSYKLDKLCRYLQRGQPAGLGDFYC